MDNSIQFLMYNTPDEDINVTAVMRDETIWLTQKTMAELFGCTTDNISLHLKNIFASNELDENATTEKISVVAFLNRRVAPTKQTIARNRAYCLLRQKNWNSRQSFAR